MKIREKISALLILLALAIVFAIATPSEVKAAPWPGAPEVGEQSAVVVDARETAYDVQARNIKGFTVYFVSYNAVSYTVPFWTDDGWMPGYSDPLDARIRDWESYSEERLRGYESDKYAVFYTGASSDASDGTGIKYIDRDTCKSCLQSGTIITKKNAAASKIDELKAHEMDEQTQVNQRKILNLYAEQNGFKPNIIVSYDIFPKRDLSLSENGGEQLLIWKNLPYKTPGTVYALCYNQIDGAYWIQGTIDSNGTAIFEGYKFRPATSITIFTRN